MKNLFAVIGLCVVLKKSYEFYREYSELKRDRQRPPPSALELRHRATILLKFHIPLPKDFGRMQSTYRWHIAIQVSRIDANLTPT